MIFFSSVLYELVAVLVIFLTSLVLYYKWCFTYWKNRGLEYLEPSIPFGNVSKLFLSEYNFGEQFDDFYRQFKKRGLKHGGAFMFTRPYYIAVDPDIIKNILQKDFSHFINRGFYVNEKHDPLSGNLFNLEGTKWRNLRTKITPTFTPGKMRMMFETMTDCAKELDIVMNRASTNEEPLDIKDILARFTLDVISSCAFGMESNCLKTPDSPLRYYGRRIVENTTWENIKKLAQFMFTPKILDTLKYKTTKPDVESFMFGIVKDVMEYRETNNVYRKDLFHLLLQLKNRGKVTDDHDVLDNNKSEQIGLTVNEFAALIYGFYLAGYETSSTTVTFTLFELSINQEVQDKVREEINRVLEQYNNVICYEAVMQMTYLDQVINEALRKYPALPFLTRICTKAYDIPNTNINLQEGTMVVIPMWGLHYDPDHFPEPEKFDPDRFSDENKAKITPFTWMPFGEGPRVCLGIRFGMLENKIGLVTVLRNYRMTLNDKTKTPLIMNKKSILTSSQSKIWLNITKLE